VRTMETNLGSFITDAYKKACDADIAVENGGSIRSSIKVDDITYDYIYMVQPFGNYLVKKGNYRRTALWSF